MRPEHVSKKNMWPKEKERQGIDLHCQTYNYGLK